MPGPNEPRAWWEWLLASQNQTGQGNHLMPGGVSTLYGGQASRSPQGQVTNNPASGQGGVAVGGVGAPPNNNWWQNYQQPNYGTISQRPGNTGAGQNAPPPNFSPNAGLTYNANPAYAEKYGGTKGMGQPGGGGAGGPAQEIIPASLKISRLKLDPRLGQGWSDNFTKLHGVDPLQFYSRPFQNRPEARDQSWLEDRAFEAAYNDAKFQPRAIAEWQKRHGNTEIPQEQWETWYDMAQNGGANYGGGVGINPWAVY